MNNCSFEIVMPKVRSKSHVPSSARSTVFTVVLSMLTVSSTTDIFSSLLSTPKVSAPSVVGDRNWLSECLAADLGNEFATKNGLIKRLDYLKSTLKENWNGEEDLPIEDASYLNAKSAISSLPGRMLKHWNLFPDTNGTLLLSPKDEAVAGISIGNNEFSYAVYVSDDKQITGKEPFSVDAFKNVIRQIHRLLGYA